MSVWEGLGVQTYAKSKSAACPQQWGESCPFGPGQTSESRLACVGSSAPAHPMPQGVSGRTNLPCRTVLSADVRVMSVVGSAGRRVQRMPCTGHN